MARRYLNRLKGHCADCTWNQLRWDFSTIAEDVRALRESGLVASTNPAKMTVDDLGAILVYWKTRPKRGPGRTTGTLDETSQHHLWKALKKLLRHCGNPAADRLPHERPEVHVPRELPKPLNAKEPEDLEYLRAAAGMIPGWYGQVATFLLWFGPGTGLRPGELREQGCGEGQDSCVAIAHRELAVCRPKGQGKWAARHEPAPIAEWAIVPYTDFVEGHREQFLGGRSHPALIPFERADGTLGYWPAQSFSKLAKKVERTASELAGRSVPFQWRDTRPTFGQLAIDGGADIQNVSVAMRHRSTRTTEHYYARARPKRAFADVRRALGPAISIPRD